jgi:hypothetical protein
MFQPRDFKKPSNKRTHVLDCELLARSMTMHLKTIHQRLVVPPKAQPGDRVAVVSLSWVGPGVFPAVHEIGMRVLREELGLIPVEYPTTRQRGATPQDRAADLMTAFAGPTIRAVLATIGGADQITVLPHLDPAVFIANPKPFVEYSDNTNLPTGCETLESLALTAIRQWFTWQELAEHLQCQLLANLVGNGTMLNKRSRHQSGVKI